MATISRFEEFEAWQTARELTRQIYTLTRSGQFARDFGLSDQMQPSDIPLHAVPGEPAENYPR